MTATAVRWSERRDPTPMSPEGDEDVCVEDEDRVDSYTDASSYASEDEPWDQRPVPSASLEEPESSQNHVKATATTVQMRVIEEPEEELDDGDLPSLTTTPRNKPSSSMGGRWVNGHQTTTRPLSPPSSAGLVSPQPQPQQQQRRFWGQFFADDDRTGEDDGPDDEMMARREERVRDRASDDYTSSVDRTATYESIEESDNEPSFCGQTLNAISDMCGGNFTSSPKKESPPVVTPIASKGPIARNARSLKTDEQVEHTAIEVEFVETTKALSPQKKNAFLTAMARRAKADFEKKRSTPTPTDPPARASSPIPPETQASDEDIYNTFDAKEKRKFLKLINGGLTPSQATQQIVQDRLVAQEKQRKEALAKKAAEEKAAKKEMARRQGSRKDMERRDSGRKFGARNDMDKDTSGSDMEGKKQSRAKRLAFWKKGGSVRASQDKGFMNAAASASQESRSVGDSRPETPVKYSARKVETPPSVRKAPAAAAAAFGTAGAVATTSVTPKTVAVSPDPITPSSSEDMETHTPDRRFVRQEAYSPPVESSMVSSPDRSEGDKRFAKSGINYYDAIRKTEPEEEEEEEVEGKEPESGKGIPTILKPRAARNFASRARGFAILKDRRAKSAPRGDVASFSGMAHPQTPPPDTAASSEEKPWLRNKEVESNEAGTLTVPLNNNSFSKDHDGSSESPAAGQEQAAALVRMENELLRPAMFNSATRYRVKPRKIRERGVRLENKVDDSPGRVVGVQTTATSPTQQNDMQTQQVESPQSQRLVEFHDLDIDIDTYMNSAGQNDAMSVYTTGTGITGASTYTQSSRRRHPGAARSRIAKAREMTSRKKQGWHESIRLAANATNRTWDPKSGWSDYEDPNADLVGDKSQEKIKINLQKSLRTHKEEEEEEQEHNAQLDRNGGSVTIPFPEEWERQRQDMIGRHKLATRPPTPPPPPPVQSLHSMEEAALEEVLARSAPRDSSRSVSVSKPTGWLETMKAATAAIAKDGPTWDPERGWAIPIAEEEKVVPDIVDFDQPSSPQFPNEINDHLPDVSKESDNDLYIEEDSSMMYVDNEAGREPRAMAIPLPPQDLSRKLNKWIAKAEATPKERSELSTESSDRAVASAGATAERYVQLGDSGSVRSQELKPEPQQRDTTGTQNYAGKDSGAEVLNDPREQEAQTDEQEDDPVAIYRVTEDEKSPLLINSGSDSEVFRATSGAQMSSAVDVVKEKVGAEDLDFFANQSVKPSIWRASEKPDEKKFEEEASSPLETVASLRSDSGSPRRGAGPVDVDEVDDNWQSDDEHRSSTAWQQARSEAGESKSGTSVSTSSFPNKPVPKLRRSKRDTSPVRMVGDSLRGKNTAREASNHGSASGDQEDGNASSARWRRSHGQESRKTSSEQFEEEGFEMSLGPSRKPDNAASAEEWRVFLEKKVDEERVAAAQRNASSSALPQDDPKPARDSTIFRGRLQEQDDDSLFEFKDSDMQSRSQRDSEFTVPDLSPIRADQNQSDTDPDVSEAYGPGPAERGSFFKRLAECAAPMMQTSRNADGVPAAHLAFMRSTPQGQEKPYYSGRYIPHNLCARPELADDADDENDDTSRDHSDGSKTGRLIQKRPSNGDDKPRSKSTPRLSSKEYPHEMRSSESSVISGEFGAKTAYLEAIAMKTAVSKPRRSDSRRRERATGTEVSSTHSVSSANSEKWKAFLERKKASNANTARSSSTTDVSKAAEKYAAEKVEEMMAMMSKRSRSAPKERYDDELDRMIKKTSDDMDKDEQARRRQESVRAAEDLAAARVAAMMAALSNPEMEEGEI